MRQLLIIPHRLPSLNEFAGPVGHWRYRKLKAETQASIAAEIKRQGIKPMPFAHLTYTWHEKNKKRDLDNIASACKFINDALVACKILPDDGWAEVLSLSHHFVCVGGDARVYVELTDKDDR